MSNTTNFESGSSSGGGGNSFVMSNSGPPRLCSERSDFVVSVAFKVHLSHQFIALAINSEVNARWPYSIGTDGTRGRCEWKAPKLAWRFLKQNSAFAAKVTKFVGSVAEL